MSSWKIGIGHGEVPVLAPPMEVIIGANNQLSLAISTGAVKAPKSLKTLVMEEFVAITTAYNTRANSNHWRVISSSFDVSTPVTTLTRDVDGVSGTNHVFPSPPQPYCFIWNFRIVNIRQTNTPSFIKSIELNTPIDRTLINDFLLPSVRSQTLRDELSGSSSGDI